MKALVFAVAVLAAAGLSASPVLIQDANAWRTAAQALTIGSLDFGGSVIGDYSTSNGLTLGTSDGLDPNAVQFAGVEFGSRIAGHHPTTSPGQRIIDSETDYNAPLLLDNGALTGPVYQREHFEDATLCSQHTCQFHDNVDTGAIFITFLNGTHAFGTTIASSFIQGGAFIDIELSTGDKLEAPFGSFASQRKAFDPQFYGIFSADQMIDWAIITPGASLDGSFFNHVSHAHMEATLLDFALDVNQTSPSATALLAEAPEPETWGLAGAFLACLMAAHLRRLRRACTGE